MMVIASRSIAIAAILLMVVLTPLANAKNDKTGSKDHPMLSRYPNSHITEYRSGYDAVEMVIGKDAAGVLQRKKIEGNVTYLHYFHNDPANQPSPLQVVRNYQNAIKTIDGEVLWERLQGVSAETTLRAVVEGRDVWVSVKTDTYSVPAHSYRLTVVESAAMQQVVSANKMLDELNKAGFITLYINFDTAKWDIKPDARPTIDEITKLLKENPGLQVNIDGHTDNQGGAAANKTLSENRAQSVVNAIVASGIKASRLKARGFGQESPIADNRSEEGRAKNRRVELVKQ